MGGRTASALATANTALGGGLRRRGWESCETVVAGLGLLERRTRGMVASHS